MMPSKKFSGIALPLYKLFFIASSLVLDPGEYLL